VRVAASITSPDGSAALSSATPGWEKFSCAKLVEQLG
jgi:hypothetical protein